MANPEHVALVRNGADAIARWRTQNPYVCLDLSETDLSQQSLASALLQGADLRGANLDRAVLRQANLSLAQLNGADLFWTDLVGADFTGAALTGAVLAEAHMSGANLSGTDLRWADLSGAKLNGADISKAKLDRTILAFLDLREVKGLETVEHVGPSSIGIETIYASNGEIPEVFLRGAGVPDTFVTFAKSLVGKPFDFYSCFISYSSIDQEFAERLHADLQASGVRCWYAPEDLRIGDRFRARIDEAIRIYDKLLIVLSENSVRSAWVETEVETAFERERRESRTMLFPIRIDDAVMQTNAAWAADIRRTRHIGDFRNWKDHDSWQKVFKRLLRDLKSDVRPANAD